MQEGDTSLSFCVTNAVKPAEEKEIWKMSPSRYKLPEIYFFNKGLKFLKRCSNFNLI